MPRAPKRQARRTKGRTLFMKFAVVPLVRMPRSVMLAKLAEFVETGVVPPLIDVEVADYAHGFGKRYASGTAFRGIDRTRITDMAQAFLQANQIRMERVR